MQYQIKDFIKIKKLGQGTYGVVHKVQNKTTHEFHALKKFIIPEENNGIHSTSLREVSLLKELQHPNIIVLQQTIIEKGKLYLLFEYMDCDLRKYMIDKDKKLSNFETKSFSYQIMQGLLFCHARSVIHRDLKPENILIDNRNMVVKIADFGMARTFGYPVKRLTHEVLTLWYRSPEIMLNADRYSLTTDVWSVGCIIAEMASGKVLFRGDSEIDQLYSIFRVLGTPDETVWPGITQLTSWNKFFPNWNNSLRRHLNNKIDGLCLDLIDKMLVYNPENRPSIREALYHKYFEDLDKSIVPARDAEKLLCPKEVYQSLFCDN